MDEKKPLEYWSLWYPQAAATGLSFGRGRIDHTDALLVHAAPPFLTVEVTDMDGRRLAFAQDLPSTLSSPICILRRQSGRIEREDIWPDERHYGLPVFLPGGEVGILTRWWNAADRREWRWQVELYNRID